MYGAFNQEFNQIHTDNKGIQEIHTIAERGIRSAESECVQKGI